MRGARGRLSRQQVILIDSGNLPALLGPARSPARPCLRRGVVDEPHLLTARVQASSDDEQAADASTSMPVPG